MESKWNLVVLIQPVIGLLLILISIYTFAAGSPQLLPWAFMLMGPFFVAMGFYEVKKNKYTRLFYHASAIFSFLFGFYAFTAF